MSYQLGMLLPGLSGKNNGDSLDSQSSLLAVYCDFSRPFRQFNTGFCLYDTTGMCDKCAVTWEPSLSD